MVRGWFSHIPCSTSCPGDIEHPGPRSYSPPAREQHAGSEGEAGVGERRGHPVGWHHPEQVRALSWPLCSGDLLPRAEVATGPVGTAAAGRASQHWLRARDVSCSGWDCGELPAVLWVALAF